MRKFRDMVLELCRNTAFALVLLTLLTTSREGLASLTLASVALLSFMLFRLTFFLAAPTRAAFLSLTPVFRLELGMRSSRGPLVAAIPSPAKLREDRKRILADFSGCQGRLAPLWNLGAGFKRITSHIVSGRMAVQRPTAGLPRRQRPAKTQMAGASPAMTQHNAT